MIGNWRLTTINHNQRYYCFCAYAMGITLDSSLSFNHQVINTCRSAFYELRRISSIRKYLTIDATKTTVCSLVLSRLDYVTALWRAHNLTRFSLRWVNWVRMILLRSRFHLEDACRSRTFVCINKWYLREINCAFTSVLTREILLVWERIVCLITPDVNLWLGQQYNICKIGDRVV